ncbi:glycosyltransferase family 2 protein [Streptomyces oryzae]|uniref:Glycosyltransferase family 2 protein n=1 Tax=Streptomyces oryzae TaxID=1434886 RepID=A0ABS3XJP9_9ACTN|nr:glycosyltransferase family 2 protein [Streptomyces oryzae]MBO8195635.1 glycosyltransferase family 2 protein [Streptomyces oryzae]
MDAAERLVSVITPAYNALPYLKRCIASVTHQSLDPGRIEMIVVNDGSTDGTAAELDLLAERHPRLLRVIHQENSGGPSGPRNRALDTATGRYVFFLDADDYLAPEALARLTTTAEENSADVVLGKIASVGRRVPRSMFRANQPDADLFTSRVYWALSVQKLFRKELLDRLQLRFDTSLRIGEDQPFTALAYLRARRISVVADYDCYYLVRRPDGQHLTYTNKTQPALDSLDQVCELLRTELEPGPQRDALLLRHFAVELQGAFQFLGREAESAVQLREFNRMQKLVADHDCDSFWPRLRPIERLRCHLTQHGNLEELLTHTRPAKNRLPFRIHISQGRALAHYPPDHKASSDSPAACFDVTEHLSLTHRLSGFSFTGTRLRLRGRAGLDQAGHLDERNVEIFLEHRGKDTTTQHAEIRLDGDSFEADFDLLGGDGTHAPMADGFWDLYLRYTVNGLAKTVRLGNQRDPDAGVCPVSCLADDGSGGIRMARLYPTAFGNLTLRLQHVAKARLREELRFEAEPPAWHGTFLQLRGTTNLVAPPPGSAVVRLAAAGATLDFPLLLQENGRLSADLPLDTLPPGRWTATLRITAANWRHTLPLGQPELPPSVARWRRGLVPMYAKLQPDTALTVRVDRLRLTRGLRRRLTRRSA